MKILWVCNKAPTRVNEIRNINGSPMGGWLDSMCKDILSEKNTQLCVLFLEKINYEGRKDNFSFYSFTNKNSGDRIEKVLLELKPDIIHIWGTEYSHTLTTIKIAEKNGYLNKCILYIQGMVSLCGKHYTEGLPNSVVNMYTFRDFIRFSNISRTKKTFIKNGVNEIEAIKKVKYVIGRTDWDRAAVEMYNPNVKYYFCNETLRESFYKKEWDINNIKRHSIFVSQCNYPIKGFHYVLEAMPEIIKHYPNAHIYTTGINLLNLSFKERLKMTSYQFYLRKLIYKLNIQKNITFLGILSEEEMASRYLKSNVFVSASTIENSPNSLGEAMLVGCPVVASDVGGVKNMLVHNIEGYIYQSTAPYMLAYYVKEIFRNDELAKRFSKNAKKHAMITHNRVENVAKLLKVYQDMREDK
ncbi:glycosyltransferase family 4 protein [uncultured Fusobacterium sp.]|uniref:glycosyltransferase family 4 protein n=1 Tax=uncultured Fusobacterium sp. TaxID=159267 RepID=UPI0025DBF7F8|nr:glycosyltransferase [uncultured Fusobacterium sp.]